MPQDFKGNAFMRIEKVNTLQEIKLCQMQF